MLEVTRLKIILVVFIAILILIIYIPFYAYIRIIKKNDKEHIELGVIAIKGLIKFGFEIPFIDIIKLGNKYSVEFGERLESGEQEKDIVNKTKKLRFDKLIKKFNKTKKMRDVFNAFINYLIKKIQIKKIIWKSNVGLDDAALTGIASGVLWMMKGLVVSLVSNKTNLEEINIDITPYFDESVFETDFHCIIKLKLAHIIIASIKGVKAKLKGGESNV